MRKALSFAHFILNPSTKTGGDQPPRKEKLLLLTILLCVALIGLDQLVKLWVVQNLLPVGTMPLIPGIIELRYVENDGAAFSLFSGMQTMLIIFTGLVLLGFAVVLLFRRPKDKLMYTAMLLILSGGVGNLIDRIVNGYVVDYLATQFMNFPVFNIADILVVVGVGLMLIAVFRAEWRDRKSRQADEAEPKNDEPQQAATESGHGED